MIERSKKRMKWALPIEAVRQSRIARLDDAETTIIIEKKRVFLERNK